MRRERKRVRGPKWELVRDEIDGCVYEKFHRQFRVVVYEKADKYTVVVFANNPESSCWFSETVEVFGEAIALGNAKFKEFKKPYNS